MAVAGRLGNAWKALREGGNRRRPREAELGAASAGTATPAPPRPHPQSARMLWLVSALIGILALVLFDKFAQPLTTPAARSSILSVTIMLAAAATAVGALLGFLFGIPRSAQEARPPAAMTTPGAVEERIAYERGSYEVNTNLEQISDWLTKILVGVGLIQLGNLAEPLGRLVDGIAAGFGGRPIDRLMVGGILVFFTIFGFLVSYLLTRLLLRRAFTLADLSAVVEVAANRVTREVRRSQELDAQAYSVVARALQPPPGSSPPSQEELNQALRQASPVVRSQAFSLARYQRLEDEKSRPEVLDRTAKVFRALIETDPNAHRHHGQLAYALRYGVPPDRAEAERELSEAIRLRDQVGERGYLYYELNRASLQIDVDREANREPSDDRKASILAGLRAAAANPDLLVDVIHGDSTIQAWLRQYAPDAAELLKPEDVLRDLQPGRR
jgi:hypothetical protein